MYTYKRAVGVNQTIPRGEELLDISTVPTKDLFRLYSGLTIVLLDSLANREVALNPESYSSELGVFVGTIQQWLDTKSTTPLKTSNTLPGTTYRYVTTHDIQYEWFSLYPGDVRLSEDRQSLLTMASARDMRVIKTDRTAVDYQALVDRSLWFINGHCTRALFGDNSIYLVNAGLHFNVNDNAHVNCWNFNTISTLKTYPVKEEDVDYVNYETYGFLHVKSPVSLKGKQLWMSIGGKLFLPDVVQPNSDQDVAIRTEKIDWFSQIFDSKDLIDLSGVIGKEREVVGSAFFSSPAFIKALMTDPSTFFIVLDNPNVYTAREPIVHYNYPFTYHTEETKRVPLMTGNGLFPKYNVRKILNRRLLDIDIGVQKKYLSQTTGTQNEGDLLHGFTNRFSPSTLHEGYLLYIRGLIQGI